jgi:hypothetical protein
MENPMALNALVLWLQTSSTSSLSACIWLEVMGRQLTFGYKNLIDADKKNCSFKAFWGLKKNPSANNILYIIYSQTKEI